MEAISPYGISRKTIRELSAARACSTMRPRQSLSPEEPAMSTRLLFALPLSLGLLALAAAQQPAELKGHTGLVHCVALSPDGKILATAGFDNVVKLWDLSAGMPKEIRALTGHTGPVYCVAFSPDGK